MNISNLKEGMEVKNYKELCNLLEVKVKHGDGKKYQLIDFDRYFKYEKKGHKFVITEIHEEVKEKTTRRKSNNILPFIDEMELLLIDLLVRSKEKEVVLSTSKLMLELCMINPNYHKYFTDRESLSKLLDMDIGYVIDFYDTTNSTFKSAINTVNKRLESKKLIIHETVMMVQFVDANIETTPTGYTKVKDVFTYDEETNTYKSKSIKPKEVNRPATETEREFILKVEKHILETKYNASNINEVFKNGKIGSYYKDVSKVLFNELNIKKAYKANRYTYNVDELIKQKFKIMNEHQIKETQDRLNLKVMLRIDENSNKRYEKAMSKLFEFDEMNHKKPYKVEDDYVDNINVISTSLIDIHNEDSLNVVVEDNQVLNDMMD